MLNVLLWLPKQIFLTHYVLVVHFITPFTRLAEANERCERMYRRLFGEKQ